MRRLSYWLPIFIAMSFCACTNNKGAVTAPGNYVSTQLKLSYQTPPAKSSDGGKTVNVDRRESLIKSGNRNLDFTTTISHVSANPLPIRIQIDKTNQRGIDDKNAVKFTGVVAFDLETLPDPGSSAECTTTATENCKVEFHMAGYAKDGSSIDNLDSTDSVSCKLDALPKMEPLAVKDNSERFPKFPGEGLAGNHVGFKFNCTDANTQKTVLHGHFVQNLTAPTQ